METKAKNRESIIDLRADRRVANLRVHSNAATNRIDDTTFSKHCANSYSSKSAENEDSSQGTWGEIWQQSENRATQGERIAPPKTTQFVQKAQLAKEITRQQKEHALWLNEQMEKQRIEFESKKKSQKTKTRNDSFKNYSKNTQPPKKSARSLFLTQTLGFRYDVAKYLSAFIVFAMIIAAGIGVVSYASKGLRIKGKVLGASTQGYDNLTRAISDLAHQNFEDSSLQFDQAYANFAQSSEDLQDMGGILLDATKFIPFASKISSGKNAVEAGKHFSAAGKSLAEVVASASQLKNPLDKQNDVSLLDVFKSAEKNIADAKVELDAAQENLNNISVDDLPQDKQAKFLLLKQKLPSIRQALDLFLNNSHIFVDLLGGNGPRKYLFLFQNNSEMRPTGGFIGSYGLLDIANGQVKKFFIDGIFNPDGQLRDKIVPPFPIQKISSAWSMHDSNWFADFPTSAQKAIQFYEKTGGPTADGVITFTPNVMQQMLAITGPIDMPEYNVTMDKDNFLEMTQYKVEEDYDKQENQPKKILSDLAPLVLDKLLSSRDINTITQTLQVFLTGLREKHILFYSQNKELEKIISQQGWSGEVLPASKDYLSVINTNINGYKTDAVVSESIDHQAQIQDDGSIIDTVTITRRHSGGNTPYDWLNKVNADYMRVYVPQGSKLLAVSGQTREVDKSPLDYDALGFKRDQDVQNLESGETVDADSGTHISTESGKTVFANWAYVSPGETMTLTYKYLLPFSLFKVSVGDKQGVDSYSLVAQKQSGSVGSDFTSQVSFPASYQLEASVPDNVDKQENVVKINAKLNVDRFIGVVFQRKN